MLLAVKSEKSYLGNFLLGDSAPILNIIYQDHIKIAQVSFVDFNLWFGKKEGIKDPPLAGMGILRDFDEYVKDKVSLKKLITVTPADIKPNTLLLDKRYQSLFSDTFKCLPVSVELKSLPYIDIYLSSDSKVKRTKVLIEQELHLLLDDLVVSNQYNNLVFNISKINVKLHSIRTTGIICEYTNFHLKYNHHIDTSLYEPVKETEILPTLEPLPFNIIEKPKLSMDFSKIKVGGLKKQLEEIATVLRPRGIDQYHLDTMGITEFEKGIILYGAPGVGKTLIARELSHLLGVNDFTVVNGPELLNKYVGESEANMRNLLRNTSNQLKVVFFDEFDCIAKERTNDSGSQVANNIVNQMLAIMDGVDEQNNLLIIAATNRLDVIDSALLRPGRFGLCLHIGLPSQDERKEIFNIHLSKNIENKNIIVDMSWLALNSENYSGAEIKGICKKAREIALSEAAPDLCHLDQINIDLLKLETRHFQEAFDKIKCGFSGNGNKAIELLPLGNGNKEAIQEMIKFCESELSSRIKTFLLTGNSWTFKSASCRMMLEQVKFDSVFIITDNLIRELSKIDLCTNKNIVIILDNLENLCSLLNTSSYNAKHIDYFNKFVGRVITGKVILIASMRTRASITFNTINPCFEWHQTYEI